MASAIAVTGSASWNLPGHKFHLSGNLSLQALVTWEGDALVCVQKGEKQNRGWKQWVEGDKLYLVSLAFAPLLPLCLHTLAVTWPGIVTRKMALSSSLPELQPNICGHIARKPFPSGSGDSRKKSVWLFL